MALSFQERLALLITADADGAIRALQTVGRTADTELGRAERKTDKWARNFAIAGGSMVGVAGIAARGLFALGGEASDLAETISKVGVIFGENAKDIESWSDDSATAFGQSKREALDAASTFAQFGNSAGLTGDELVDFSTELTELASDMASFSNTTPEEAIVALGAALRGENEPIRRFNVLIDDATLRNRALKLGIIETTKDALTPQQKVLAAHAEILEQTKLQQGDFARTAEGAANQQRIFNAQLDNFKANVGQGVLPVMTNLFKAGNEVLGVFNDLDPSTQRLIGSAATFSTIGIGAAGALALLTSAGIKTAQQLVVLKGGFDSFRVGLRGVETGLGGALPNRLGTAIHNFGGLGAVAATGGAAIGVAALGMRAASRDAEEYAEVLGKVREELAAGKVTVEELSAQLEDASFQQMLFDHETRAAAEALEEYEESAGTAARVTDEATASQRAYADLLASGTATERELDEARARVVETSGEAVAIQNELSAAIEEGAAATEEAAEEEVNLGKGVAATNLDLEEQAKRLEEAKERLDDMRDAAMSLGDSQIALQESLLDVNDAAADYAEAQENLASGSGTLEERQRSLTDAELALKSSWLAAANDAVKFAEDMAAANGETLTGQQRTDIYIGALQRFRDELTPGHPLRAYLDEYILQLKSVPSEVTTSAKFDATQFEAEVSRLAALATPRSVSAKTGLPYGGKAHGGPVSAGQTYVVGEEGPELLVMGSQSGNIIPNGGRAMGGGAPITIHVSSLDPKESARLVFEALKEYERRNGALPLTVR